MSNSLIWTYIPLEESGETEQLKWQAESFYESEPGVVGYWEIFANKLGLFAVDCSDYQMTTAASSEAVAFETLGQAKSYCEQAEYALQCELEQDHDVMPLLRRRDESNRALEAVQ